MEEQRPAQEDLLRAIEEKDLALFQATLNRKDVVRADFDRPANMSDESYLSLQKKLSEFPEACRELINYFYKQQWIFTEVADFFDHLRECSPIVPLSLNLRWSTLMQEIIGFDFSGFFNPFLWAFFTGKQDIVNAFYRENCCPELLDFACRLGHCDAVKTLNETHRHLEEAYVNSDLEKIHYLMTHGAQADERCLYFQCARFSVQEKIAYAIVRRWEATYGLNNLEDAKEKINMVSKALQPYLNVNAYNQLAPEKQEHAHTTQCNALSETTAERINEVTARTLKTHFRAIYSNRAILTLMWAAQNEHIPIPVETARTIATHMLLPK